MSRFLFSAFADEAAPDLAGQIAACRKNGIGAIELRGVDGDNISDIEPAQAKEIKKQLDKKEIAVSALGTNYGKMSFELEDFQSTVAVARILEAPYIRMFSFYSGPVEERIAKVRAMVECAAKKRVKCCLENEKGVYGDTPERVLEILQAAPGLGYVFDFANFMECGCDTWEAYRMLKPYITYFHIKDYSIAGQAVVPAGQGDGHIAEILADYDSDHTGQLFLTLEPHLKLFEGLGGFDEETRKKLEGGGAYATQAEAFRAAAAGMKQAAKLAQPVALGIIGFGNMGSGHARYYLEGEHKGLRIAAVADTNPARLEDAEDLLPGVETFGSAEELIESGLCNAVLIATPHYFHPPIAIAALRAGLHVMCEKPAGVYTKQVREMNEAAAESDQIFAIMYNQRTNPLYQKLRELVQGGQYGELKRVVWVICDWYRTQSYYNSGGWRATWAGEGGGVLLNQCPHNLDLWQWICGMPCKVRAACHEGRWHDIEVEDDVTIYAEYPNGATGAFITTTGEPAGANRLEITLDRAKILSEGGKLSITELDVSTKEHIESAGGGFAKPKSKTIELVFEDNSASQHATALNAFARAIQTGDRSVLYARGEEGINGLSISNAAFLSSWLERDVALPVDEALFWAELQKKIAGSKEKANVTERVEGDLSASFG
ncbi:MAG: Gfo/Idh/MocA family oxidoreductase [Oscillospiraceae bacterium]|jgi:predicted dehydrogenase/sugar phosphate isomerase/epimerase|nr:Gfo/Idh/MocA family oxidoreductase [Oscillospiraceae bacterium]